KRAVDFGSLVPLLKRSGDCDQRRSHSTRSGQLGPELSTGIFVAMRGQESEATEARTNRRLSIAYRRSKSTNRRICRRAEEGAGRRKNPARWIIERHGEGDRTGEKGCGNCQRAKPL